jgi:propanol-preferring alcohol dehydrogenase
MMSGTIRAMRLEPGASVLAPATFDLPEPAAGELLLEVNACGVCRTDLHVVDGDLHGPRPVTPGHEVVGHVIATDAMAGGFRIGDRVGVPWLGRTCGTCVYCRAGRENLCDNPLFTGFTRDGGFATHCIADARYCLRLPESFGDVEAAPLLCAGLIGYRALKMAGEAPVLGIYGFGAAAHIVAQVALWQGRRVFAFTRADDLTGQAFARSLGCEWAGSSVEPPPAPLDAAIIVAPVGALVPGALKQVRKGGRVVCAGIHMSDIPGFPYADLWGERAILSVANLTRADGDEFMALAAKIPVRTTTTAFPLEEANEALQRVREGKLDGAAVLVPRNT